MTKNGAHPTPGEHGHADDCFSCGWEKAHNMLLYDLHEGPEMRFTKTMLELLADHPYKPFRKPIPKAW
jgi:hypothetical protein